MERCSVAARSGRGKPALGWDLRIRVSGLGDTCRDEGAPSRIAQISRQLPRHLHGRSWTVPEPIWVVTPYNRGQHDVPGMADGRECIRSSRTSSRLHLTGYRETRRQAEQPCITTRPSADRESSSAFTVDLPGDHGHALAENAGFKCYVVAEFSAEGTCERLAWAGLDSNDRVTGNHEIPHVLVLFFRKNPRQEKTPVPIDFSDAKE